MFINIVVVCVIMTYPFVNVFSIQGSELWLAINEEGVSLLSHMSMQVFHLTISTFRITTWYIGFAKLEHKSFTVH